MIGIIPAGGKGTRLKPITDFIPKELLLYGHKPFIGHCIETLKSAGMKKIIIVVGHKKGAIMDYLGDGKNYGVSIDYAYQAEQLGLGDAIVTAQGKTGTENELLVLLGDNVISPPSELAELKMLFNKEKPFAAILVEEISNPERFGVVKFSSFDGRSGSVVELFEKPNENERKRFEHQGKYYAISGAYVLSSKVFDYIKKTPKGKNKEIQLTDALALGLKNGEKIIAMKLNGKRIDIGTPFDYLLEQQEFYSAKSRQELERLSKEWNK